MTAVFPVSQRIWAPCLLVACLGLFAETSSAQFASFAQSEPQSVVANVLDAICDGSGVGALQADCVRFTGVLGNGNEGLTLQQFAHEEYAAVGNLAVEFSSRSQATIDERLDELRGAEGPTTDARATFSMSGLGGFVASNASFGEHAGSEREDPFDVVTAGVVIGLDHWIGDRAILGVALRYENRDLDFRSTGRVSRGRVRTDAVGASIYGSIDLGLLNLDGTVSFTHAEIDLERRLLSQTVGYPLNRTTKSKSSSQTVGAVLTVSRTIWFDKLSVAPYGGVGYGGVRIGSFRESGALGLNLRVRPRRIDSLQSRLGVRATWAFGTKIGVLVPQVNASWRHEFLDDDRNLEARFLDDPTATRVALSSDPPDRDFASVGVGLSLTLPRGVQTYAEYETVLDLRNVDNHAFRIGLRLEN